MVLCPNTTIQGQWIDKARQYLIELDALKEDLGGGAPAAGVDPSARTPVLALTYQLFSSRQGNDDEVDRLFSQLAREGYRTIVMDECHHLTGHWAEVILAFLEQHEDAFIIGLTATPPRDRSPRELQRYLSIVGPVDAEVPLAAVVRDGLLSPFQDLARFVIPTERERMFIHNRYEAVQGVIEKLAHTPDGIDPLPLWVERRLLEPQWRGRRYEDFAVLSVEAPRFAAALIRFMHSRHLGLPRGVFDPQEVPQPLGVSDLGLIIEDYIEGHLADIPGGAPLAGEALAALEPFGFHRQGDRLVRKVSPVSRVLAFSGAKLAAMREVLIQEMSILDRELRAVVLTDYVKTHGAGESAPEELLDPEAGGAIAAFRSLLADPRTDALDPVLVTGEAVLVDDEIAEQVLEQGQSYLQRQGIKAELRLIPGEGFCSLEGKGSGWCSRTYVGLITDLLKQGVTRCIIGTRALLGEGWDCEPLNTLVDLTSVSAFVTVNQVRGRTLRLDPEEPAKTANNWDIVAVLPGITGGEADLERFFSKHERFYGPTDDGDLERGAGHVHPSLTHLSRDALFESMAAINEELLDWSANRSRAFKTWRVGTPYRDEEIASLELIPPALSLLDIGQPPKGASERAPHPSGRRSKAVTPANPVIRAVDNEISALSGKRWPALVSLLAFPLAIGIISKMGFANPLFWAAGVVIMMTLGVIFLQWGALSFKIMKMQRKMSVWEYASSASLALAWAMKRCGLLSEEARPQLTRRSDESIRVRLEEASAEESSSFAEALKELLGPFKRQRYLLVSYLPSLPRSPWKAMAWRADRDRVAAVTYPVPSLLASHREKADQLAWIWSHYFGPSEAFYIHGKRGKEGLPLLLPLTARRPSLRRLIHQLWR